MALPNDQSNQSSTAGTVAVYVVTYRRHKMLRRAITSVLNQTHTDIALYVVNDDPDDLEVDRIVDEFADPRARMFLPAKKRGATSNFNLVFKEREAPYSALLEDDNWWEPAFVESQLSVLEAHPDAPLVIGNERIWKELPGDEWADTGQTIWPTFDVQLYTPGLADLCGSAKLCNSSMLVRTRQSSDLLTPETIPVDVTEHFRERLLPSRILLNGRPLANYSDTLKSARGRGALWGQYQVALIGSSFMALAAASKRRSLANELWRTVKSPFSPRATALVHTGLAIREARALLTAAPVLALTRSMLGFVRHPNKLHAVLTARSKIRSQIDFLASAPLTRELAEAYR